MLRVLQINSVYGVGSTGRIAADIHSILVEQGHESYIAYGRDSLKPIESTIKIGSKLDNYVHLAVTRLFDQHGFGSKQATKEFLEKIEQLNPDIIHLHNIHGYYVNIEELFNYLKKANKPVVWTLHDCWPFTGHCAYFDYARCYRWKVGCYSCPQRKEYPSSLVVDNSKRNFVEKKELFTGMKNMTIVTPSKWLAGLVKESFLKEHPVKVINNGIDLENFKPTDSNFRMKYNLENKFVILGAASVWEKRKGYDYFINLSKQIDNNEIIVMIGLSERQKKGLPHNIIGLTRTNSIRALAEIYSAADVFVNPTLEDNFPTTNLESLACGTPVVTFNTGGSGEALDNNCGFVVEKGNLREIFDCLGIIKDKGKLHYKRPCIERAKKLYDKTDKFKEYIDLYREIVQ